MSDRCPPITFEDLDRSTKEVQASVMEKAQHLDKVGSLAIATNLTKAVALIDISKTARANTGNAAGDAYLEQARELMLGLLNIR